MKPLDDHDTEHDDETTGNNSGVPEMPCAAALLAGTLGLMTMWADPCQQARCSVAVQRRLMARKIVSNLFFLMQHPQVAPPLRAVMSHAHRRWLLVAASVQEPSDDAGDQSMSCDIGVPATVH